MAENEFKAIDTQTGAPQSSGSASSLFNAFYVFKYSGGVATIDESTYVSNNKNPRHGAQPEVLSNPSASAIIDWSKGISANPDKFSIKNSPYSWSDFLFCKWYGIIPNNRLVTLRKYPLGSADDAAVKRKDSTPQNIPVAQAVTWFGGPSNNDINGLWQNSWSLTWEKKSTAAKDVQGNEITNFSQALVNALPKDLNPLMKSVISSIAATKDAEAGGGNANSLVTGTIEEKKNTYLQTLWGDSGAFWNQIQGPVNVKNQFLIRGRGLSNGAPDEKWTLTFEYKTDSYFGMNQRRVALDIIANMLALTYSDGEWLESLNVYYKKVGLKLAADEQKLVENAFQNGVINPTALAAAFAEIAKNRVGSIIKGIADVATDAASFTANSTVSLLTTGTIDTTGLTDPNSKQYKALAGTLEVELTKALASSFPMFLQQRASVANIPTGNWHLTIGNPMNPIMRIGDLVVKDCTVSFGDELGPDDFPIDMKFVVGVGPTKPRDASDIRRTFNNGRIDYIDNFMGANSDQFNTYAIENKALSEAAAGNNGNGDTPKNNTNASATRKEYVETWLNSRYSKAGSETKFVDTDYLTAVYFYTPAEVQPQGGNQTG